MTICIYATSRSPPWLHEAYKTCSKVSSCLRVFTALTQGKIIFLRHGNVSFHNVSGMTLFRPLTVLQTSQYTRVFHTLKDWQKSHTRPCFESSTAEIWAWAFLLLHGQEVTLNSRKNYVCIGFNVSFCSQFECFLAMAKKKKYQKKKSLQQKKGPMVIVHIVLKSWTCKTPTQAVRKAVRKTGWHQVNFCLHFLG